MKRAAKKSAKAIPKPVLATDTRTAIRETARDRAYISEMVRGYSNPAGERAAIAKVAGQGPRKP